MKIKIISDSTCDLSKELVARHNIRIVPLSISKGDESLKDGVEITPKEIFAYFESGAGMCRTSAINSVEYKEIWDEELQNCDAIIHFIISAEMSACMQNALVAAEDYDNVYLVDSRNLSTGMGHLVLDAAEMAEKSMDAKAIHEEIKRRIPLVDASFVIDTLTYLHKGGRCTGIQKFAASMLSLKPCIGVKDGKMGPGKKYRGKLSKALGDYVNDKLADKSTIDTRRLFITHTLDNNNLALAEAVKAQVAEIMNFDEIHITTAGSTVSCHCGPNTLGILFYRKQA